jgi:N-acetylglucosaminyl-diphospho-decaprenol L-rhamnosyltransferase
MRLLTTSAELTPHHAGLRMDGVVVTHNSAKDLAGLLACEALRDSFGRLIIVDNASVDSSRDLAQDAGAELITNSRNMGFAAAANEGARRTSGSVFALMNPDVRVESPTVLRHLVRHFEDPSVGIVAPALTLPDGRLQDSAREIPTPFDLIMRRLWGSQRGALRNPRPYDVPWVVGAFALVRRDAFEEMKGFDDTYRLYFEDVDLCLRLQQAGWRIRVDPTVRAFHHHRAESRSTLFGWATRQHIRSATLFYLRNPAFMLPRRLRALLPNTEKSH